MFDWLFSYKHAHGSHFKGVFEKCVLKCQFGGANIGTVIERIEIKYDMGLIEFHYSVYEKPIAYNIIAMFEGHI